MKKQNIANEPITKDFLLEQFGKFEEGIAMRVAIMVEKAKIENDDKAQLYRDQILNRMDKDVSNYEQVKNEQVFIKSDITGLQERVGKLEHSSKSL